MGEGPELRDIVEFLRKSDLINLDTPLSKVVEAVSELAPDSGYVFILTHWVFVSPPCASPILTIGSKPPQEGGSSGGDIAIGEQPVE